MLDENVQKNDNLTNTIFKEFPFSKEIWNDNYNSPLDNNNVENTFIRLSKTASSIERKEIKNNIQEWFYENISTLKFIPGGRIMANLGVPNRKSTTLYNCFVHHPKDIGLQDSDSIEGIYTMLKAQAHTLKSEGGYGLNASWIRPSGLFVAGIGSRTPGVLSFMELWDTSSKIITQGSSKILGEKRDDEKNKIRKGAQMLILDVWHPDIEEFIVAKQTPNRLTKFNMSVGITDGFMDAVIKNKKWELIYPDTTFEKYETEWNGDIDEWKNKKYPIISYKKINAVELWERIMKSTYNRAEPGVVFLDIVNKYNPLKYTEKIFTTNPCVTGDTLIAVADGRNAITIKELYDNGNQTVDIYSIKDGKVIIGTTSAVLKTGINKKIYKLTLDDGSILRATNNHLIMMRDSSYKRMDELKKSDSLMPFNSTRVKNYRQISSNVGRDRRQYRLIAEYNEANYNHKVESIEFCGYEDVYDLTVPDTNNFGIITSTKDEKYIQSSGIFIHNCGEIPMSTGVCNLGSINLVKFVKSEDGKLVFDYEDFRNTVKMGIRFLDNINDIATVPLKEYEEQIIQKRRIGLGTMGWGSLHFILGIRWGSKESLKLIHSISKEKAETEILYCAQLGKEKGSFPVFDKKEYFNTIWWKELDIDEQIKKKIEKIGHMRNSHQSMSAPNGNTAIYALCVSGGGEPCYLKEYIRWSIVTISELRELITRGLKFPDVHNQEWFETEHFKFVKRGDEQILKGTFEGIDYEIDKNRGLIKANLIEDYGWKFAKKYYDKEKLKKMLNDGIFATTVDLEVQDHIEPLKIMAHYINQGISKTINVPKNYSYEDFKKIYLDAWKSKIKGITTYRDGTMTAVLESTENKETISMASAPKRPVELPADIYAVTAKGEKFLIAVGLYNGAPYEIFGGHMNGLNFKFQSKKGKIIKVKRGVYKLEIGEDLSVDNFSEVFTPAEQLIFRLLSTSLRHGNPIKFIVEQMQKAEDDLTSLGSAVTRVLKKYINDGEMVSGISCPQCHNVGTLIYQEGCNKCTSCGWSKC